MLSMSQSSESVKSEVVESFEGLWLIPFTVHFSKVFFQLVYGEEALIATLWLFLPHTLIIPIPKPYSASHAAAWSPTCWKQEARGGRTACWEGGGAVSQKNKTVFLNTALFFSLPQMDWSAFWILLTRTGLGKRTSCSSADESRVCVWERGCSGDLIHLCHTSVQKDWISR